MDELINKITVEELKENPPKIEKKFLLVESSLYTDEAYEYLLELINETDSIAFIRDKKKIYTHGEYFGGDIWEDQLFYFGNFQIFDSTTEEIVANLKAEVQSETIRFSGINNIQIIPEEEWVNGTKYQTIKFGYDIANSIDTSEFTIDDPTSIYHLEIKDEKISVSKYTPIRVTADELNIIEYDTPIDNISFNINVFGTDNDKNIFVTSSNGDVITLENNTVTSTIVKKNIDIDYLIIYSDSRVQDSIHNIQRYGFGNFFSNEEITPDNFNTLDREVKLDTCSCEFSIDLGDENFGWFACPSIYNPIFIDKDTNIGGGWKKVKTINLYSINLEYSVYRTENSGLGKTTWKVI